MSDNIYNEYKDLVAKYSKVYYKKLSDLYDLEDLEQEIWSVILETIDEYRGENDATERTFLVTTILTRMTTRIANEIKKRSHLSSTASIDVEQELDHSVSTPEEELKAKELYKLLAGVATKAHKYGKFVLDKSIEGYTCNEISIMLKEQGVSLSRQRVNIIQNKIKSLSGKKFSFLGLTK